MALEQFRLEGQVAIVTGAGKGVGQGIARVLAEAGATVAGTARTESDIVGTTEGIENAPDDVRRVVKAEISNTTDDADKRTIRAIKKADDLPAERS